MFNVMLCILWGLGVARRLDDVLRYNAATDRWEKTGKLDRPRSNHGASSVKWDDIATFLG